MIGDIVNHLWQSTVFAGFVFAATVVLRRHSPRLRYWLWLAASAKFLVPFSLLLSVGTQVSFPPDSHPLRATTVTAISTVFAPAAGSAVPVHLAPSERSTLLFGAVWSAGFLCLLLRWFRIWLRIRNLALTASALPLKCALPVLSSSILIEPGIFGIIRPVLLLPDGIRERLTPEQFDAVITHELRHWRCRDNLTAAFHMCVEAVFWFHPLTWWIGARLIEERERDCDEAVLIQGGRARDYAEGIITVCRYYVESPLACASGISGADLKKRVRNIMEWHGSLMVTKFGKTLLAAAAVTAFSVPFVVGLLRAQSLPPAPAYTYEVVSIRPSPVGQAASHIGPGPQGGVGTENTSAMQLLTFAYDVRSYQFVDVPSWVWSEHYDVSLTPDKPEKGLGAAAPSRSEADGFFSRSRQRMQAVLRDRFGLMLRAERRTMPIYTLKVASNGHKLSVADPTLMPTIDADEGRMKATAASLKMLAVFLSSTVDRPVTDETGLSGSYNFNLQWSADLVTSGPNGPDRGAAGPSIFTALSEQLGLRLDATRGAVPVYVIEKIERPSQN